MTITATASLLSSLYVNGRREKDASWSNNVSEIHKLNFLCVCPCWSVSVPVGLCRMLLIIIYAVNFSSFWVSNCWLVAGMSSAFWSCCLPANEAFVLLLHLFCVIFFVLFLFLFGHWWFEEPVHKVCRSCLLWCHCFAFELWWNFTKCGNTSYTTCPAKHFLHLFSWCSTRKDGADM